MVTPGKPFVRRSVEHDRILGVDPKSRFDLNDLFASVHPEDREYARRELEATLSGKQTGHNVEHRIIRKNDGAIRWVNAFGHTEMDRKTKKIRLTTAVIDITDRKKIEMDREMLVATLSHDLRNPLATARAHAELLKRFPDRLQNAQESLDRIILNIQRADQMIQDLLDVTRVRAGEKLSLPLTECDLAGELRESLHEFTVRYGDRFRFIANGDFQGSWACHDIRRAVENLVENAVKYGSPDRPVTIVLSKLNEHGILLSVKNEGNPISPEDQKSITEPFRRAKNVEGGGVKGWGLGLSFVRSLVEALGGRILLESSESAGTTFSIEIPF
jgi:PAS domain S-box-containing protein